MPAGPRSYGGWVAVVLLGAHAALRLWMLAPMPHCWQHDSVGRNDDGSYSCYDRGWGRAADAQLPQCSAQSAHVPKISTVWATLT